MKIDFTFFNYQQKPRKRTLSQCMRDQLKRIYYAGKNDFRSVNALVRRGLAAISRFGYVYLTRKGQERLETI
jgi:hypothetical protein